MPDDDVEKMLNLLPIGPVREIAKAAHGLAAAGDVLRRLRENVGLSCEEAAARVGLPLEDYKRIERGLSDSE